jgi:hypothetical protein
VLKYIPNAGDVSLASMVVLRSDADDLSTLDDEIPAKL